MSSFSRRNFIACGLLGSQALLAACGGGEGAAIAAAAGGAPVQAPANPPDPAVTPSSPSNGATSPSLAPDPVWNLGQSLRFMANGSSSFDLNSTLPAGIVRGGTFSVNSSGAALPAGLTLTSAGLLQQSAQAAAVIVNDLVFSYVEP